MKKFCFLAIAFTLVLAISMPAQACWVSGNCRVTGGGNITSGIDPAGGWDGTVAQGSFKSKGKTNFFTFGGQAGANTAGTYPEGNWTHHQNGGPFGYFVFHGYYIDFIECSDPGPCSPAAANGEFKQINFGGYGRFNNSKDVPFEVIEGQDYWFEVHIEDLGEPGNKPKSYNGSICPAGGSDGMLANCGCPDFYRIRIYTDPVYEVSGYLTGGNFQIHRPTGFDMNPAP